jgi:hypothetical protein
VGFPVLLALDFGDHGSGGAKAVAYGVEGGRGRGLWRPAAAARCGEGLGARFGWGGAFHRGIFGDGKGRA